MIINKGWCRCQDIAQFSIEHDIMKQNVMHFRRKKEEREHLLNNDALERVDSINYVIEIFKLRIFW